MTGFYLFIFINFHNKDIYNNELIINWDSDKNSFLTKPQQTNLMNNIYIIFYRVSLFQKR